ncbi:MAG TPA: hypothetical protein VGD29_28065 [Actinoplanes sp.]|jgi:hypothetical protein
MKRRLRQGIVASLLAVTITLPGGARPAQAFDPATISTWIAVANAAYNLVKNLISSGASADQIKAAVQQIQASIDSAKTQILSHVDALATADAQACARHHVIEFDDINQMTVDTLQQWAQDATGCAVLIDSLIKVVTDKSQVDQLNLAANMVGPIALAARVRAGFSTAGLTATLRDSNNAALSQLAAACLTRNEIGPNYSYVIQVYSCTAYNGYAEARQQVYPATSQPPINPTAVANQATANTSRAVSVAVLPTLQF